MSATPQAPSAENFWQPMAHPAEVLADPARVIVGGDGVHVVDDRGHKVVDAVAGLWNVTLGYSVDPIKQAITAQLSSLPYYSSFRGTTHPGALELARKLSEWFAPEGMTRSFFTSGGSDSVETALRLARQYWKVRGERDRYKFISLRRGYHGTHFGGAAVNGNLQFRRNYEPLLPGCSHIPAPFDYRNPFDETDPQRLGEICARLLDEEIQFQGPDTVAAFIAEPVLGAGGVIVPPANFWPLIRQVCDKHGVLLIADEVVTAFGRTGHVCGARAWGVKPDMMCFAKAITNGYFPFGGVMINERVASTFESNHNSFGAIGHGYTYSAHPVGCAAALATLAVNEELQIHRNAALQGERLLTGLRALQDRHSVVGNVRGKGLMACVELVSDRRTKTPVDKKTMARVADKAFDAGAMIRVSSNNVILSPPLVLEAAHVDTIVAAIDAGLAAA
ncbi:MAG TPA: aminotransferase class III-fold pyridoxal phosphate-dependent enzyme [Povalibacter sp.]|nr:aminotransferase class III-fold pyridoxal phosphate-dependent enzyme [Povalibacter sp.]